MDNQNKNLVLATALSFLVILVWFWLFPPEVPDDLTDPTVTTISTTAPAADVAAAATVTDAVAEAATEAPRVPVETPELTGSISLLGGRIDDLYLSQYRASLEDGAETVRLMRPVGDKKQTDQNLS